MGKDHPFTSGLRKIYRDVWVGIANDLQDMKSLMPPGVSPELEVLALSYYVALAETAVEVLQMLKPEEPIESQQSEPPESDPVFQEMLRSHNLIWTDGALTHFKTVFEILRHDAMTVPFQFSELDAKATTTEEFREICFRELHSLLERFEDEAQQAMAAATSGVGQPIKPN